MYKLIAFIILLVGISDIIISQELNCKVEIVSDQIQGTDKRVYDALKTAIYEFMNNKKWTTETFKNEERIDCNLLINITARLSTDEFTATLQAQSRRPIFKTSYNSVLLNYKDEEIQFKYLESQPLEFVENTHTSNLTSILAYYAYLIIGLDYDSFSMNGGTPYFQKAINIVNNAQNAPEPGWTASLNRQSRYWFINNMMEPPYAGLRECMYNYHRKGLDIMVDNKEEGRAVILENILALRKVHQARPLSFNMKVFFNGKADEIINVFSEGTGDEKSKLIEVLNDIDPTNSNKYQKILTNQ